MKVSLENINLVANCIKQHFENPNGEFDSDTDLRVAFNTVIDWIEDDKNDGELFHNF